MVQISQGGLVWRATIDDSQLQDSVSRIESRLSQMSNKVNQEGLALDGLLSRLKTLAVGFATFEGVKGLALSVAKTRGEFQQLEVAFSTILKSKEKATVLMDEMLQLAAKTPFNLQDVATGAKQLLAYGFEAEKMTDNLTMLGNVAAGVSAPLGDLVYVYGTLRAQGRAYTRDIMQFAMRGIPIYEELANVLHVNKDAVKGMVEAGKVGFPEVEKAFKNMTGTSGKFYNLMQEQSKTITGLWSNLEDAVSQALNNTGKKQEGSIADIIKTLTSLVENYEKIIDVLKVAVLVYGSYRAGLILTAVQQRVMQEGLLQQALAQNTLSASMIKTQGVMALFRQGLKGIITTMQSMAPTAVITAIAAVGVALYKVATYMSTTSKLYEELGQKTAEYNGDAEQEIAKVRLLSLQVNNLNLSNEQRQAAYNKLNEIAPNHFKNLTIEHNKILDLTSAVANYSSELRKNAIEKANAEIYYENIKKNEIDKKNRSKVGFSDWFSDFGAAFGDPELRKKAFSSKGISHEDIIDKQIKEREDWNKKYEDSIQKKAEQEAKDNSITSNVTKNKAYWEAQKKKLEDEIDGLTKSVEGNKKKAVLIKQLKQVKNELKFYETDSKGGKTSDGKRNQVNEMLLSLEGDAGRATMDKTQSELDKIREKYDRAKRQLDAYKKQGVKVTDAQFKRLENARDKEIGAEKEKQNTENLQKEIEDRKQLYSNLYEFQKTFGNSITKEIYKNDYSTFLEYLNKKLEAETNPERRRILAEQIAAEQKEQLNKGKSGTAQKFEEAYQSTLTYNDKVALIDKEYNEKKAELSKITDEKTRNEHLDFLEKIKEDAIDKANEEAFAHLKVYEKLQDSLLGISKAQLKNRIKSLKELLENTPSLTKEQRESIKNKIKESEAIKADTDLQVRQNAALARKRLILTQIVLALKMGKSDISKMRKELEEVNFELDDINKSRFQKAAEWASFISKSFSELANSLGVVNSQLGEAMQSISILAAGAESVINIIGKISDGSITKEDKIKAGVGGVLSIIGMITSQIEENRKKQEEWNNAIAEAAHQASLARIELEAYKSANIFGVENPYLRAISGAKQYAVAMREMHIAAGNLENGQVQVGTKKVVSGKNVATAAVAGAAVGSIIPGVGTAIGAAVGAIGGAIVGLFAGKKRVAVFENLKKRYGEIYNKDTFELNPKILQDYAKLDSATKKLVDNWKEVKEKAKQAQQQMEQNFKDLAGDIGKSLSDSLVKAFRNGDIYKSIDEFHDYVSKTIESIIEQIVFSQVFQSLFDDLENRMKESFGDGGDQSIVDDILWFADEYQGKLDLYGKLMKDVQDSMSQKGIDLWKPDAKDKVNENSLKGAYARASQESIDLLSGRTGAVILQLDLLTGLGKDNMSIAASQLEQLVKIEKNTYETANNTNQTVSKLDLMISKITTPNNTLKANGI